MEVKLKDVIHLYMGAKCLIGDDIEPRTVMMLNDTGLSVCTGTNINRVPNWYKISSCKLILRPLSDMTKEEAEHFAWLCMDSAYHLDKDSRMDKDEIQTDLQKDDGGLCLDADIELYIQVEARCFTGAIVIRKDGSITCWDDTLEKEERVDNIADKIRWLLSKSFDLFNLIPTNQAIDKNSVH